MARNVRILKHFELPKTPGVFARLLCLTGPNKGIAYFLEGNRIVLGRGDTCDIVIKDLKTSREHGEITKVGKEYVITDLGSHNGIIVNDLKIKQHRLVSGEKVILGKTVYKFGFVNVEESDQAKKTKKKKDEIEEVEKKGLDRKSLLYIVIFIFAFFLFFEEDKGEIVEPTQDGGGEFQEISSKLVNEISRRDRKKGDIKKEEMTIMFQRGLREFREKNYFRALEQFELALSTRPNDSLALFYRRKTIEALDNNINDLFIKARRSRAALKYASAGVSYCAIMRLLYNKPEDQRYKDALKYFEEITVLRGFEKDEISCD